MATRYRNDHDGVQSLLQEIIQPEVGRDLCRVKRPNGAYGGYKTNILTDTLSAINEVLLICVYCKGVMKKACISSKGKQFCSCCEIPDCDLVDRYYIPLSQPNPHEAVRNIVPTLKCACPLKKRGCHWLESLGSVEDHLDTCGYVLETCKLGCGVVLQRNKHDRHEEKECKQRIVKCEHCKKDFKFHELAGHFEKCPKKKISCKLCGTIILREDMERHLKCECGKVVEECILGCGKKLTRDDLKLHVKDTCTHRKLSCEHCKEDIKVCDMAKHLEMCPKVKVSCGLCGVVMCRENMTQHLERDCTEKEIECPFVKYKCEMLLIKRKDLKAHLDEKRMEHMELKLNAMEIIITTQSEKYEREIQDLMTSNELLYSITNTTKLVWLADIRNLWKFNIGLHSPLYQVDGFSFSFQIKWNAVKIHFPGTTTNYSNPFKAKFLILMLSKIIARKRISCEAVEVKQKALTKGCYLTIASLSEDDIIRYGPHTLELEVYVTML